MGMHSRSVLRRVSSTRSRSASARRRIPRIRTALALCGVGILAGTASVASGSSARGATFSPIAKGDIIASLANGQVNEYSPSGSFVQTLIPNASTPTGSAFDGAGNLYVTEFSGNDILKVDGSTGAVSVFSDNSILGDGTSFDSPESIAFGPGYARMYVSDANRDGAGGGIHIIDTATGKGVGFLKLPSSSGSDGTGESDWLAFNHAGTLFMTNENQAQGIMQVDQSSGDIVQPSLVANLPDYGYALSFDASGNIWLSDTSSILEYDPSGNLINTITNPSFQTIFSAVFNPPYNTVYVGDLSSGNIFTYDLHGNLLNTFNVGSGVDGLSVAGTIVAPSANGYVAMGDSYSSGEGLSPYESPTDSSNDHCHRSDQAYGPLVDAEYSMSPFTFVACSGAVTQDFFASNHSNAGEPAQIHALKPDTAFVTFTIGGNDVGFVSVVNSCLRLHVPVFHWVGGYGCSKDKKVTGPVQTRLAALAGAGTATTPDNTTVVPILDLLLRIHQLSPQATIEVGGYPHLFGSSTSNYEHSNSAPSKYVCNVGGYGTAAATIDYQDAQWMNSMADKLDGVIQSAVTAAIARGVPAVYVDGVEPDFAGHGLCDSSTSWINGLSVNVLGPNPWSFHPTAAGQSDGYKVAFGGTIPTF